MRRAGKPRRGGPSIEKNACQTHYFCFSAARRIRGFDLLRILVDRSGIDAPSIRAAEKQKFYVRQRAFL